MVFKLYLSTGEYREVTKRIELVKTGTNNHTLKSVRKKKSKYSFIATFVVTANDGIKDYTFEANTLKELAKQLERHNFLITDKYNLLTDEQKSELDEYQLFDRYTHAEREL